MKIAPIRLAMRTEGDWWVAYLAESASMEGAFELGRIRMSIANDHVDRITFGNLMSKVVADVVEEKLGQRPDMIVKRAEVK